MRFRSQKEKHELSHLYEAKIKNMGNAGRNVGEYYTPRPLIRAMIAVVKPKIGERIYDGAVGSAEFYQNIEECQMILHIPHSAIEIPNPSVFFALTDNDINLLTDWFTDELFYHPQAEQVVFPYSRLWCDVERFRDDSQEIMTSKGMGVVYTYGATGNPIRKATAKDAEQIKKDYYDPHHAKFNELTNRCLSAAGRVVVVDCHSFPGRRLVHEFSDNRPDFCLGTDEFHTPKALVASIQSYLENRGFTTLINDPYEGTMVPSISFQQNKNVKSIMVEVNRDLYLESPGVKNRHFNHIKYFVN